MKLFFKKFATLTLYLVLILGYTYVLFSRMADKSFSEMLCLSTFTVDDIFDLCLSAATSTLMCTCIWLLLPPSKKTIDIPQ